jgi:hypothetical protein
MRAPKPMKGSMLFGSLHRANTQSRRSVHLESLLLFAAFHIPLTLIFVIVLVKSMSWETVIDTPMFMYSGFLMDRFGMVPVRDFFTYNMLGTHVIFRWLYHYFGGSILGMRLADTAVLAVILLLFARILKPFGLRVAWGATVIFGLLHLSLGTYCYLQRDYLALVPLMLAILSASAWFKSNDRLRWFMTGLFTGSLATIKPHLMLGGIVLFGYLVLDTAANSESNRREWLTRALRIAWWCVLGSSLPILWMAAYLDYYGVLGEFVRVLIAYFPLHADINGSNMVFKEGEKLWYRIMGFLGTAGWDYYQLAMGVGAGVALFVTDHALTQGQRKYGNLLLALGLTYLLYPCIAARFYDHHYYPFRLLSVIWVAYCFRSWSADTPLRVKVFAWSIAAYVIAGVFYVHYEQLQYPPSKDNPYFRTVILTRWLDQRLGPNDTVQAIEWAFCGSTHALLQTETKPATQIIWGEVLFHHVSNPFVQDLRKQFVAQLTDSAPRFIVQSKIEYDFVQGSDCTRYFPELDALLTKNYFVALDSHGFRLWESNISATADKDREQSKPDPADTAEEPPLSKSGHVPGGPFTLLSTENQ